MQLEIEHLQREKEPEVTPKGAGQNAQGPLHGPSR